MKINKKSISKAFNKKMGWKEASLFLVLFSILVMLLFKNEQKVEAELREKGILTIGKIVKVRRISGYRGARDHHNARYRFMAFDKDSMGYTKKGIYYNFIDFEPQYKEVLLYSTFPVIYLQDAPLTNRMLISKKDFEKFNLVFPDSLLPYQDLIYQ